MVIADEQGLVQDEAAVYRDTQIPAGLYVKWGSRPSKPISEKGRRELQKRQGQAEKPSWTAIVPVITSMKMAG